MIEKLPPAGWTRANAAHLLRRAGFGGTPSEVAALHARGLDGAVAALLAGEDDDLFPPPQAADPTEFLALRQQAKGQEDGMRREVQQQIQRLSREHLLGLRVWWLDRMRWTTFPAREKATLFWHGHWATSAEKVREPYALWKQNETLRAFALGSFREMARQISRDPAMIRYLDLQQSRREKPNENFARELMELFTLGEGNYSERDVREAARAFTGYRIRPETEAFAFVPRQHDDGPKTVFGRTGHFAGDDVIDLLLEQPACARFLCGKLWTFYAGVPAPDGLLDRLAEVYRTSDYSTAAVLGTIFRSRAFYAPGVVGRQVKSPVQWLVGSCRELEVPLPPQRFSENLLRELGQLLFAPPNVKGWDGGRAWISSATLLARYNAAAVLVEEAPVEELFGDGADTCGAAVDRLFATPPPALKIREFRLFADRQGVSRKARADLLHLMMSTPEFQLT